MKLTSCGVSGAFVANVSLPDASPRAVGANCTVTWQEACGARELPQVLAVRVSEAEPETTGADVSDKDLELLVLVSVMVLVAVCETLTSPNACVVADSCAEGTAGASPVPDRERFKGAPTVAPDTCTEPETGDVFEGVNVTLTVQ